MMTKLNKWFAGLSKEEKTKMFRRGIAIGLIASVGLGFLIWKMNEGTGVAATTDGAQAPSTGVAAGVRSDNLIEGFRSAKFGEDEAAVRKAIEKDFGKSGDDVKAVNNAATRTKALIIRVKDLIPDSGEAQIVYSLGYKSKALFHVYVLWGTPITKDTTIISIAKTNLALKGYFSSLGFDRKKTITDRKMKNGSLISFHGVDSQGHSVDLIYNESKATIIPKGDDGKPVPGAKPETKPIYTLRLTYAQDPKNPDIFVIDKGAF